MSSPEPILKIDENTELRLISKKDASELFHLIDRNRFYLRQWMGWVDGTQTSEDLMGFINSCSEGFADGTQASFLIWHRDKVIGIVHLRERDKLNNKVMIGYWVGEEFRGRSFAKKCTRAIIDYAFQFLKVNRIEIRCATENLASQSIPIKLGFTKEGVLRANEWLYDHYVDHVVFSILADEWNEKKGSVNFQKDL
jgi:ribosomal-protein-serine acetyltransferase